MFAPTLRRRPARRAVVHSWTHAIAAIGACALAPAAARGQCYRLTDLGTLGDDASGAYGLNASGEVSGWSQTMPGEQRGFYWHDGQMHNVGTMPGGGSTIANGLNDAGQITGHGYINNGFGFDDRRAFLWQDGQFTVLPTLGGGQTEGFGINNHGAIVGVSERADHRIVAFRWDGGLMTELPLFPGSYPASEARAINDAGDIVGGCPEPVEGYMHATLWPQGGGPVDLGALPGGSYAMAHGLNDSGVIVGMSWGDFGYYHAFVWQEGVMVDLGVLGNQRYSVAYDVNNAGQIVGESHSGGHGGGSSFSVVLWEYGKAFNLGDLVHPDDRQNWGFYDAYAINDAGQIAGTGVFGGGYRAFRLDPIPDGLGLTRPYPGYTGVVNTLSVRGATPGGTVHLAYGMRAGSTVVPGCPGMRLDIAGATLAATTLADQHGHAELGGIVPAAAIDRDIHFQVIDRATCRKSNVIVYNFFI